MIEISKKTSNKKGSLTVEMALVFPFIFVFVIFICFAASMIYNRTTANSIANKNLDKAAIYWLKSNIDFQTGEYISADSDIYSSLYDFKADQKKESLSVALDKDIHSFLLAKNVKISTNVTSKNYVIFRKLKVDVNIDYGTPFKGIFKLIGINKPIVDTFQIDAVINNPVEFTRNVDIALEIYKEVCYRMDKGDPLGNFKDKLDKIKETIDNFDQFAKGN
ncbi:TadE/TadG family type IV pilus assembly protein [Clostridium sp. HBUAS56017]|uniref:TadE/TadG family type IV pilus assembly protein n=1 Tax=Clostridium sp. HBUAS56017 TaxID=2571128 RepID=UPI001177AD37|nr:TadE/TadG family type IV pilus assembly protein [Clostridium sp. HBUAS56017]